MEGAGDKMVTNAGAEPASRSKSGHCKGRKKQGPIQKVKAGSAVVPIYRTESGGRVRFTLSFYRDGRRLRKVFTDLEEAPEGVAVRGAANPWRHAACDRPQAARA
jgi:hypothetical protein